MDQQQTPSATPPGDGPHGDTADEAALRALLHQTVEGLHGSPDALVRLRRAIPARRRRKQQARVGAAAALVLVGMAVPALVRAAGTGGEPDTAAASVRSAHTPSPGEQGYTRPWDVPGSVPAQESPSPSTAPAHAYPSESVPPTSVTSVPTAGVPVPDCLATQLGDGISGTAVPDADGRVYGWFRVANVSGSPCAVPNGGVVRAVAHGSPPSDILVVAHRPGDPAPGLPAAAPAGPLVLAPGANYEVAFAWVPDSSVGPGGCATASPPPVPPTPTAGATATPTVTTTTLPDAPSAAGGGTAAQADARSDAGPQSSTGIALEHTPAAGAPVVDSPVIEGACTGTVYTTAALPGSSAPGTDSPTP